MLPFNFAITINKLPTDKLKPVYGILLKHAVNYNIKEFGDENK